LGISMPSDRTGSAINWQGNRLRDGGWRDEQISRDSRRAVFDAFSLAPETFHADTGRSQCVPA
jgi:hypothetical protein